MSQLNIVLRGLAFCRPKPGRDTTEVVFPHAPNHSLNVIISKFDHLQKPIPGVTTHDLTGSELTFAGGPQVSSVRPPNPERYITNIGRLHRTLSRLSIKLKQDVRIPLSYLELPTANLFSTTNSVSEFEIWVHKRKAFNLPTRSYFMSPLHPDGKLAQEVSIYFDIPAAPPATPPDSAPAMTLNRMLPPFELKFKHELDANNQVVDHQVVFDNHCTVAQCASDFGYYYEMLNSVDDLGYSVEIEEFPLRSLISTAGDSIAACNPVLGDFDNGCDLREWFKGNPTPLCGDIH